MGGCGSKSSVLSHLDDSVKVMVRHDAKALAKRGQTPGGFVPRAQHPILEQMQQLPEEENKDKSNTESPPVEDSSSKRPIVAAEEPGEDNNEGGTP